MEVLYQLSYVGAKPESYATVACGSGYTAHVGEE